MNGRGELGRLVPETNLRSVWPDEARDFTPWLAQPENLEVLEDALGLTLEVEGTEHGVGPYRADIVCRDDEGRRVFIENQLEATDHQHLGQLLTYAGGLDGRVMVWIAKRFTDDHRAAIDWLNTNTRDGVEFYAVEIQLWRIGASGLAPRFNVVCRPNAWRKKVVDPDPVDGSRARHLRFWTGFSEYVARRGQPFRTRKPSGAHWSDVSIGRTGIQISMVNRWNKDSLFMIYIQGSGKESYFRQLSSEHKALVERTLSPSGVISWREMKGRRSAIIQVTRSLPPDEEATWPAVYEWFCDATISVLRDLKPTLLNLRYEPESPEVVPDESDNHDE
jgi:hypothetical protein